MPERWGVRIERRHCDLELQEQRTTLIARQKGSNQGFNIVINNAGFVGTSDLEGWSVPYEQQSVKTWRRALEVNLTAVFDLCQGLNSVLKTARGASIVNIASIYGSFGPDWRLYDGTSMSNPAAYGA